MKGKILETRARVHVSIRDGEVEIEGTEEFVTTYRTTLEELLKRLTDTSFAAIVTQPSSVASLNAADSPEGSTPSDDLPEFGEALHLLSPGATGTDKILIASFYASRRSADSTFSTADANKLLVEQGIKLANAAQSMKNNMDQKRVFRAGKNFRLSREGVQRVGSLLGRNPFTGQ